MTKAFTAVERERQVRAMVEERGLRIEKFGKAWRVYGNDAIDVIVQELAAVSD
jgi:hypothetical protein